MIFRRMIQDGRGDREGGSARGSGWGVCGKNRKEIRRCEWGRESTAEGESCGFENYLMLDG
jgi:hypothetical protein